ncbi:MAG: rubrerythrin family protein [Proteobacteria bacterium]|nr:rubrerythrin family protein [Pseudomonadota bacterium]
MRKEKIEKNLAHAFSEESKMGSRYGAFVLKAEQEGYPQLARFFRAVANAKSVHARRFLYLLRGKIGTTQENLKLALEGEVAAGETLLGMIEEAKGASKAVKKAFIQSNKTDGEYARLLDEARRDMLTGTETVYYVCQICGHIHKNDVPENCPVCKAVSGRFKKLL